MSKCDESGSSSSSPNQIVPKANENILILHVISVIISCLLAIATLVMVYLQLDMRKDGEKDGVIVATTPKVDGKLTFFRDNYGKLILETMTGRLPSTHRSELKRWVETIEREKVFDKEMGGTENAQAQMTMLLKIGIKCCKVDEVEKRPELMEVANKIQQLDKKDI
ncbi:hypothetical protein Tco_0257255 [Tanacetum coccineum]